MYNVIKSDLYKLFKSKFFYIIVMIAIVFASLNIVATYIYFNNPPDPGQGPPPEALAQSGRQMLFMAMNSNLSIMLIGILTSIFIAKDYNSGIIKDTVSSHIPRHIIYFSKVIVTLMAVFLLHMIVVSFTGVASSIFLGYSDSVSLNYSEWLKILDSFFSTFYVLVAFTALFSLISTKIRSLGPSIGINVGIVIFAGLVIYLISIIHSSLNNITNYWLSNNINSIVNSALIPEYSSDMPNAITVSTIYIMLSVIMGIFVFKKQDIK